jgi:hypothetical protein
MFERGNIPIWIGILLMAGLFLMGQVWPTAVCDWIADSSKVSTECDVGIGTAVPRSALDVAGKIGFSSDTVNNEDTCTESEWGIISPCLHATTSAKGICACVEKYGDDWQWRWVD